MKLTYFDVDQIYDTLKTCKFKKVTAYELASKMSVTDGFDESVKGILNNGARHAYLLIH